MSPEDLMHDLRSRINPRCAKVIGTESYERKQCADAIQLLIEHRENLIAELTEAKAERDQLAAKLERLGLQKTKSHAAPCAGACESQAFRIEIRQLKAERDKLQKRIDGGIRVHAETAEFFPVLIQARSISFKAKNATLIPDEGITL